MSIFRRMKEITVATFNDRLESAEDPVRMIDQYLADHAEQIRQTEKLLVQCLQHAQSLRNQYVTALQTKERREQQALTALKAGEEEIAKLALQEKMTAEETAGQYGGLYEDSKQSILELEDQLKQLKLEYDEVAAKRSYYQARMESVRLQQRMNERAGNAGRQATPRMFSRLEDRIAGMELEAQSLRDVRKMTREALYQASWTG
jgi:phage shock protein A